MPALYKKPKDLKYTDMAIYVDQHIYSEDCDDSLIFEYLYHIAHMLGRNGKYFNNSDQYEDFAIYFATKTFMRLKNKKQDDSKQDGTPKMTRIKSCLNFMKNTVLYRKIDFEQEEYSQVLSRIDEDDINYNSSYTLAEQIQETVDDLDRIEFNESLGDICLTAKKVIANIPYKTDITVWTNIYLSCLLSFLNSITLKNKDIERISNFKREYSSDDNLLVDLYEVEKQNSTILYHLGPEMYDYITVLTNRIRHAMARDLSSQFNTYIPSNSVGNNSLVISELNGELLYSED